MITFKDYLIENNATTVKVGDKLKMDADGPTKGKTGTVISVNDDSAQVDFGGGDKYGISLRRIADGRISECLKESDGSNKELFRKLDKELFRKLDKAISTSRRLDTDEDYGSEEANRAQDLMFELARKILSADEFNKLEGWVFKASTTEMIDRIEEVTGVYR